MAIIPERVLIFRRAPDWMRDGTGERLLYLFGLTLDASLERALAGIEAADPLRSNDEAKAVIGSDLLIPRGLTEESDSYGVRLQQAIDAWGRAGFSRAVLGQILGYLLQKTPRVRIVSTRYERDPGREQAIAAAVGIEVVDATNASPIVIETAEAHGFTTGWTATVAGVVGNVAANGSFAITVLSSTTFSLTGTTGGGAYSSGGKVIASPGDVDYPPDPLASQWETYAEGQDPNTAPVHTVGAIGGDGEWDWDSASQVSGSWSWYGAYLILESVGDQSFLTQAPPLDTPGIPGLDEVDGYALGFTEGPDIVNSVKAIAGLWKTGLWFRETIVSFDASLFDPTQPADGIANPDGTFGSPYKIVNGAVVPSRFADAEYCGEII